MINIKAFFSVLFTGFLLVGCGGGGSSSSGGNPSGGDTSFDKSAMLDNYSALVGTLADDFKTKSQNLQNSLTTFDENTSKQNWKEMASSYKKLQAILQTDKSQSTGNGQYTVTMDGITPIYTAVDSWLMGKNGEDKDYGIAKLEYILFDPSNGYNDGNKSAIGAAEAAKMVSAATKIKTHWSSDGSLDDIKTASDDSVEYIANRIREYIKRLIDGHIGLGTGLLVADNGVKHPEKVESKLSSYSKEQAIALIEGIKNYYIGGTGSGLDDMLIANGYSNNNDKVIAAFNDAINKINAINGTLYDAITNDFSNVEAAFSALQELDSVYHTNVLTLMSVTTDMTFTNDGDTVF